jgi:hypothetical protein
MLTTTNELIDSAFVRPSASDMNDDDDDNDHAPEPDTPRASEWTQSPTAPPPVAPPPQGPRPPSPHVTEESKDAAAAREIARELDQLSISSAISSTHASPPPPPPPPAADKPLSPMARTDAPSFPPPRKSSFDDRVTNVSNQTEPLALGKRPMPPPPAMSLPPPRPTFSATSSAASFSTPPEYPASTPLNLTKSSSRSNLPQITTPLASPPGGPMSPSYPTGGAKISAAAFRRNQGSRNPSGTSLAEVAPLQIGAKRSLPSSPYPTRAQSPPVASSGTVPLDIPGQNSRLGAENAGGGGGGARPYSTYSTAGSDFADDYISSYMSSSPSEHAEQDPMSKSSGYGGGRFTTNLDQDRDGGIR